MNALSRIPSRHFAQSSYLCYTTYAIQSLSLVEPSNMISNITESLR